jgi:hypothetical protein
MIQYYQHMDKGQYRVWFYFLRCYQYHNIPQHSQQSKMKFFLVINLDSSNALFICDTANAIRSHTIISDRDQGRSDLKLLYIFCILDINVSYVVLSSTCVYNHIRKHSSHSLESAVGQLTLSWVQRYDYTTVLMALAKPGLTCFVVLSQYEWLG